MPFLSPVRLEVFEDADDRPIYQVLEPFHFYCTETRKTYVVAKGFFSDGASVPRSFFLWLIAGGKGLRASVLHDWLYQEGMRLKQIENRREADDVLWHALRDTGHGQDLSDAMWDAVNLFGREFFNNADP